MAVVTAASATAPFDPAERVPLYVVVVVAGSAGVGETAAVLAAVAASALGTLVGFAVVREAAVVGKDCTAALPVAVELLGAVSVAVSETAVSEAAVPAQSG